MPSFFADDQLLINWGFLTAIYRYYVDGRTCTCEDFYDPYVLDYLLTQLDAANVTLAKVDPKSRRWLGETSSAWGGGAPGLSDRYVAGFM